MEEDRLSNLPKFILHDILSRLSRRDAARTSVLSKAWAETWSTFPVLSIFESQIEGKEIMDIEFIESEDYLRNRKKFCDKVERTLLRFKNQRLAIKQIKLCVNNFHDLSKEVDDWLKLVCETSVEGLELRQPSTGWEEDQDQCYILPTSVFEAKSLTKLVLRGRNIGVDLTFINHSVNFFSLQVLLLGNVCLENEQQLNHLISRCPLIEHLALHGCSVYSSGETHLDYIKSLSLHGLTRLKSVHVEGIQEVNVDSLSLEKLDYSFCDQGAPCKINFDRCRNLKRLCLECSKNTVITENWFLELFLKFPILESLKLHNCTMPKRINISSDRLMALTLSPCSNVNEINIVAPNLLSRLHLGFRSNVVTPSLAFFEGSSRLVVNIETAIDYHNLFNFQEFIKRFIFCHVWPSISISLYTHWPNAVEVEFDPIIVSLTTPPPSIKHLILRNVPDNEDLYFLFMSRLLLCCIPTTISFSSDSVRCNKAFVVVFYAVLMGKKYKCYCNSGDIKCWWHNLKGVKVSSSMKIGENVDFNTMLDAFETSSNMDTISFNLEF